MAKKIYIPSIGDRVVFVDENEHEACPDYYPKAGTVGVVVEIGIYGGDCRVQWPDGSTSGNGLWDAALRFLRPASKYERGISVYERLLKYATERRDECSEMANNAKEDFERIYQTACTRYWAGYIDGLNAMREAQDV